MSINTKAVFNLIVLIAITVIVISVAIGAPVTVEQIIRPTEILLPAIIVTLIKIAGALCPGAVVMFVFVILLERYARRQRVGKDD